MYKLVWGATRDKSFYKYHMSCLSGNIMTWLDNVTILEKTKKWGRLTSAQFAADLWDVVQGDGRLKIYKNPANFFKITYPTEGLKGFINSVLKRISSDSDSDPVIELESGFGGGKSHTLLACYHTLNTPDEAETFLEEVGWTGDVPRARIAIYNGFRFNPVDGTSLKHDPSVKYKTPWGLIFAQLGGRGALSKLEDDGNALRSPTSDIIIDILNEVGPCVILIDEIVWTSDMLTAVKGQDDKLQAHQVANFLQVLADAVSKTDDSILVYTIPEKESEFGNLETKQLFQEKRTQIKERLERVSTPRFALSEGDIYGVIRRRIFDTVNVPIDVIDEYIKIYEEDPIFPERVRISDYGKTMDKSYPFHPELLKVIHEHIAVRGSFQKTRDVLRLLTFIVRALQEEDHVKNELILLGDFPLTNSVIKDFLMSNDQSNLAEPLEIDIRKSDARAKLIDRNKRLSVPLAVNLATSIFLQSLSSSHPDLSKRRAIHGVTTADLYVATRSLEISNTDIQTRLKKLTDTNDGCYFIHTEQSQGVTRYLFKEQRTLTSLLHEFRENVSDRRVELMLKSVLTNVQGNSRVKCITDVKTPSLDKIPDDDSTMLQYDKLRLIFPGFHLVTERSAPEDVKNRVAEIVNYSSWGSNRQPRKFRNSLAVVIADRGYYQRAVKTAKNILAGEGVKNMRNPLLTDDDRRELNELSERWKGELDYQVLVCFSHIFFPKKGNGIRHLSLGVDSFDAEGKLADRILNYLLEHDYISKKVKAEILVDSARAYWNTGSDGNAEKIMSISDLWLAMCRDASVPRLESFEALWMSVRDVVDKKLGILVKARSKIEASELRIDKKIDYVPTDGTFTDYYLMRYGTEYKAMCNKCEDWKSSDMLVNSVCPSCQDIDCPTCGSNVIRRQLYGDGTCKSCKGKTECKSCKRFVDENELRKEGNRCVHCQGMSACPRCGGFKNPDVIKGGSCSTCREWKTCDTCGKFDGDVIDGVCVSCRPEPKQETVVASSSAGTYISSELSCLKCGETKDKLTNRICEDCSKKQRFIGKIDVDTSKFASMNEYIISKLIDLSKMHGKIGVSFDLETDKNTSEEALKAIYFVRETIAQLGGEFSEES